MRVTLLGVRGSLPAPGPDFVHVGGHTSCVAIGHESASPTVLLDAGTGLVNYSRIDDRPFRGTVILGHLHWDHIMGLPFFRAGDHPEARVRVLVPEQGAPPRALLDRAMSPPIFPIDLDALGGDWTAATYDEGRHDVEGFEVLAREIPHKGGRSMGLRVSDGTSTVAYLSDHGPQAMGAGCHGIGELHDAALELASGADLLIHDAQYTMSELDLRWDWGHAAAAYAVRLAEAAGARRVVLFHHDPSRTDAQARQLHADAAAGSGVDVILGAELATFDLPAN